MGEIKVIRYECDVCRRQFDFKRDYDACMAKHRLEEIATTVGYDVVVDIGGPGMPSMMGGQPSGHEAEYVTGRTVQKRKGDYGPEALVELENGSREWCSGWQLREWARLKDAADYRAAHREEIEAAERNCSGVSIIMTYGSKP